MGAAAGLDGRRAQRRDVDQLPDARTREEVRAKLSHFVRSRWFEPPFGGATFTRLLLDALDAMAASERGPRLLPDGQPLDLFVTVTDFTGHPERHAPQLARPRWWRPSIAWWSAFRTMAGRFPPWQPCRNSPSRRDRRPVFRAPSRPSWSASWTAC